MFHLNLLKFIYHLKKNWNYFIIFTFLQSIRIGFRWNLYYGWLGVGNDMLKIQGLDAYLMFFRFDDPLLLERYRMMQPPYLPFGHPGMLPPPGMHQLLASGRFPPELLHQQFPFVSSASRLPDHISPSLSERWSFLFIPGISFKMKSKLSNRIVNSFCLYFGFVQISLKQSPWNEFWNYEKHLEFL